MSEKPTIDHKKSGVKATLIEFTEPPMYLVDERWHGPLGAMLLRADGSFLLCCPGCGQMGSGRDGAIWTVTKGSWADVSTMTLSPSIQKSCCGWHGHLRDGVFVV